MSPTDLPRRLAPAQPAADDFEAFVVARIAPLVRTARGLLKNPHDAEDVVQDVLVKAHLHWTSVQRAGQPDAYVRRMLVNACTSFWRRTARREFAVDAEALTRHGDDERGSLGRFGRPGSVDPSGGLGDRDRMMTVLRRLPARQRAVLVLRHYEDLDDAAIADAMGISVATVRSQAHRGLARLRDLLAEETAAVTDPSGPAAATGEEGEQHR